MKEKDNAQDYNKRIKFIDGLRAFACLIVLFAHLLSMNSQYGQYASGCGKIGVWFFMVVSGYLTILPYLSRDKVFSFSSLLEYYSKKIVSIYPAYLICLSSAYLLGLFDLDIFKKSLFCVGTWGHFWFIPAILQFYLFFPIFPAVYKVFNRIFKNNRWADAVFSMVLILTGALFCYFYPYVNYIENSISIVWYFPVFILGMLLAIIEKHRNYEIPLGDFILIFSIIIMLIFTPAGRFVFFHQPPSGWLQNKYLLIGSLWGIALWGISASRDGKRYSIKNMLSKSKLLGFISKISFEIYLVHYIILLVLHQYTQLSFANKCIITIVTSVLLACLLSILRQFLIKKSKKNCILAALIIGVISCTLYIAVGTIYNHNATQLNNNETDSIGASDETPLHEWESSLYVPTMISKYDGIYFINDCWNHRIIYNDQLDYDLATWKVLTDESYVGGHTIAADEVGGGYISQTIPMHPRFLFIKKLKMAPLKKRKSFPE